MFTANKYWHFKTIKQNCSETQTVALNQKCHRNGPDEYLLYRKKVINTTLKYIYIYKKKKSQKSTFPVSSSFLLLCRYAKHNNNTPWWFHNLYFTITKLIFCRKLLNICVKDFTHHDAWRINDNAKNSPANILHQNLHTGSDVNLHQFHFFDNRFE